MSVIDYLKLLRDAAVAGATAADKAKVLEAYNTALEENAKKMDLEVRVRELEEALRFKEQVQFRRNVVWVEGDPDPFCSGCWDSKRQAVRLTRITTDPEHYCCPVCSKAFCTETPQKRQLAQVGTSPPVRMPEW